MDFVASVDELEETQRRLAAENPLPFRHPDDRLRIAGVFVCFGRGGSGPGAAGDQGWGGAATFEAGRCVEAATMTGRAGGPYQPGFLALREGRLHVAVVERLREPFDVLMINATGRDHPRRAGLALHIGAYFGGPSVGVTHRPLLAQGAWPADHEHGACAPLTIGGELVGYWVRTRANSRPLAIHAAWRTDPDTAVELVLAVTASARTPEPLRMARRLAREARSRDTQ